MINTMSDGDITLGKVGATHGEIRFPMIMWMYEWFIEVELMIMIVMEMLGSFNIS